MKNKFLNLIEENQIKSLVVLKIKKKDKDGKESEEEIKREIQAFRIGDQIDVHQRILEGEKERIQVFSGVVVSRRGEGLREMFTVRRIVQGEGVERTFPLNSPKISKIEVKRTGVVRRAKLYYLRDRVGKATRLRERKSKAKVEVPGTPEGSSQATS
jgi:large subunit ribosomal protein L19